MHVLGLRINNYARIVAVDISPKGNVIRLTGENGEGKTSVLSAIWVALKGKSVAPKTPVHLGAKEADIRLDLGKYIVTRTFALTAEGDDYTTSVTVENADGARFPSPQKLLDSLVGDIAFDPLVFARSKSDDQFDELASFVPGVDFKEMEALNRGDYEKRRDVNKRAVEARAAVNLIVIPTEIPEKVDEEAIKAELSSASRRALEITTFNTERQKLVDRCANLNSETTRLTNRISSLQAELATAQSDLVSTTEASTQANRHLDAYPPAPEPIDTAAATERLSKAQAHNKNVADILENVEKKASRTRLAEGLEKESQDITDRMEARDAAKSKAISEAKMPVEGLGFAVDAKGNGYVTLNGIPFSQASKAEQIKTSVAIAASKNPTLRVIHIGDASLLDKGMNAWLEEFAAKNDLQVWCELVGEDAKVGFVIEDGRAKPAEEKHAA